MQKVGKAQAEIAAFTQVQDDLPGTVNTSRYVNQLHVQCQDWAVKRVDDTDECRFFTAGDVGKRNLRTTNDSHRQFGVCSFKINVGRFK
ncbi:hypothetical protein ALP10_200056 [Pseudomonas syringae pv. helianthi]|uniref:Uncharacterized protein n=1 Tax=Pseudomonas syringae pv. helianthi TaxID=251654 RepID=A0A3M6CQR5_9PSED|nr:hypothetical protein ALP10_200056 [Pseudomonas syringae pv. helianthi]